MLDFGPKVLVVATAPAISLRAARGCSFFALYPPVLLTHILLTCTYSFCLTLRIKKSNRNLSFSTTAKLKKTRRVSGWEFLSCPSMSALYLKDAKSDGIFGAREITTLKAKKQKTFISSCYFPQSTDLLYCHSKLALKEVQKVFCPCPTAFPEIRFKPFPQLKHCVSSIAL